MKLTKSDLIKAGVHAAKAELYFDPLVAYLTASQIDTYLRVCHFVSQTCHESIRYTATVENLNYGEDALVRTWPKRFYKALGGQRILDKDGKPIKNSAGQVAASLYARNPQKLGNFVYSNRMGNGSESSGQGFNFRGRGLIQLTGLDNYIAVTKFAQNIGLTVDYVQNPQLLEQPIGAVVSACWYWMDRGLNKYADQDRGLAIGQIINIGSIPKIKPLETFPNGYKDRVNLLNQAKVAFQGL